MGERTKTKSKHFYDDEIIGVLENGDIYLEMGVKRLKYGDSIDPKKLESHINYSELNMAKILAKKDQNKNWDDGEF